MFYLNNQELVKSITSCKSDWLLDSKSSLHTIDPRVKALALSGKLPPRPQVPVIQSTRIFLASPPKKDWKAAYEIGKGLAVGLTTSFISVPFERRRFQLTNGSGDSQAKGKEFLKGCATAFKAKAPNRMAGNAIFMGSMPATSSFTKEVTEDAMLAKISAASMAGVIPCMITIPVEKIVEKIEKNGSLTFSSAFKEVIKAEGVLSLWQGAETATLGYVVHRGLFVPGSEFLKEELLKLGMEPISASLIAGGLASIPVAPANHFFFRISAEQREQAKGTDNPPKGTFATAKTMVQKAFKEKGLKGFTPELFKGLSATVLRAPLVGAVTVMTCEAMNRIGAY